MSQTTANVIFGTILAISLFCPLKAMAELDSKVQEALEEMELQAEAERILRQEAMKAFQRDGYWQKPGPRRSQPAGAKSDAKLSPEILEALGFEPDYYEKEERREAQLEERRKAKRQESTTNVIGVLLAAMPLVIAHLRKSPERNRILKVTAGAGAAYILLDWILGPWIRLPTVFIPVRLALVGLWCLTFYWAARKPLDVGR